FKTADELAGRLGIDRASPQRARAALRYVLQELSHEGHTGFPETGVLERTTAQLPDLPRAVLTQAIEEERLAGGLVRERGGEEPWLYLKPLFLAELGVARCLRKLCAGDHPLPALDAAAALAWVEKRMGLELATSQRDAISQALRQ